MIIESIHELVPPETIKPVIEKIIANFVTDYCPNQNITVGLNAIREILIRQPLALDEAQIEYLIEFRSYRNKSVMSAARSLINFFREVCPMLLPKKYLGRDKEFLTEEDKKAPVYGEQLVSNTVDGAHLLKEDKGGVSVAALRALDKSDFRRMEVLKKRMAMRKVDKHGFRSDDDEKKGEEVEDSDEGEEGEDEFDDEEFGESEMMEEYGEEEMSEEGDDAPELVPIGPEQDGEEKEEESSEYESSIDPLMAQAERDSVHDSEIRSSQMD